MENEKIRILKMVEEGKLKAEEAVKLIEALEAPEVEKEGVKKIKMGKARFLKIRVTESGREKPKVNLSLPLGLIRAFSKFVPKSAKVHLNDNNIDIGELINAIEEDSDGKLIDIHDDEDGERVEIYLE